MYPILPLSVLLVCGVIYGVEGKSCFGPKCPNGWIGTDKSCYLFSNVQKTWEEAKAECGKNRAILAEVNSVSENKFLMNKARELGYSVWIGATDTCTEGTFEWDVSGDSVTIGEWAQGQPDNWRGNEDCVVIQNYADYKWNDLPCTKKVGYVCEKNTFPIA